MMYRRAQSLFTHTRKLLLLFQNACSCSSKLDTSCFGGTIHGTMVRTRQIRALSAKTISIPSVTQNQASGEHLQVILSSCSLNCSGKSSGIADVQLLVLHSMRVMCNTLESTTHTAKASPATTAKNIAKIVRVVRSWVKVAMKANEKDETMAMIAAVIRKAEFRVGHPPGRE